MQQELTNDQRREMRRCWQDARDSRLALQDSLREAGYEGEPGHLTALHELFDEAYTADRIDVMHAVAFAISWHCGELLRKIEGA